MTTNDTAKRIFGVGFKDHVEIRVSSGPIKAEKSAIMVPSIEQVRTDGGDWDDPQYRERKKKVKFEVVYWRGGKVVGGMSNRKFLALTGIWVQHNECKEVTKEAREKIIKVLKENNG